MEKVNTDKIEQINTETVTNNLAREISLLTDKLQTQREETRKLKDLCIVLTENKGEFLTKTKPLMEKTISALQEITYT